MKALITGGAGFLGSNLSADLLKNGYEVVVVDNFSTGSRANIDRLKTMPNFTFFEMCIVSPQYKETFNGNKKWKFDEVYHLACPTGVPNIEKLGEEMMDVCSLGTKNVLETALKSGARLVFTSSSEIYGDPEISPQSEEYTGNVHPQGPRANYEEGKRFSETLVQLYVQKYGLNARTLRLFNVYGPNLNVTDTRVIPTFIQSALQNKSLPVHGDGSQRRTLCFVSDLVSGLQITIKKGKSGEIYNIGSDEEITMANLAKKVIEITASKSVIKFTSGFSHDHKFRMPNLEKIHSLGWKRKIRLEEGLKKTAEYFRRRMEK
jgi:nucleoside-diphosphate-sugar epimerase